MRQTRRPLATVIRTGALGFVLAAVAGAAQAQCAGDCDGDGAVTVDELIHAVDIVLGTASIDGCLAADANQDGRVAVDEVVQAVGNAQVGCGGSLSDLDIPDDFDYGTSRQVAVELTVCTPNGHPFPGVGLLILPPPTDSSTSAEILWQGSTDATGRYRETIQVPARFAALRVVISAIGIVNDAVVPISSGYVVSTFGCPATGARVGR